MKLIVIILLSITAMTNLSRAEDTCFRVTLIEKFIEANCKDVKVQVYQVNCSNLAEVIKDHGPKDAQGVCDKKPYQLITSFDSYKLVSELKEVNLWGNKEYQVGKTKSESADVAAATPAPAPAPVLTDAPSETPKNPVAEKKVKKPTVKKEAKKESNIAKKTAAPAAVLMVPPLISPAPQVVEEKKEPTKASANAEDKSDTPVKIDFSGFVWFEYEHSKNFGYNGSTAIPNFTSSQGSFSNLFSNFQVDVTKGPTKVTSIFEIGEVMEGESSTGGNQGGRQKIVEVRNLFLGHDFNSEWNVKLGLQPILSDPNAFILSDHYMSQIITYTQDWGVTTLWGAKAAASKPGVTSSSTSGYVNPDQYAGLQIQNQWNDDFKSTIYGVTRRTRETFYDTKTSATVTGKSDYQWIGTTLDFNAHKYLSLQGTYIYNSGAFVGEDQGPSDSLNANLVDVKFMSTLERQKMTFLLEGLATTGSNDSVATGQTSQSVGFRKNFSSPNPGAAYLLTIATSDAADDAPGNPKESVIGNLSQAEGIQIYVFKVSKDFSDRISGFVRAGILKSATANAVTNSSNMGQEFDLNASYKLNPNTILQVDYAEFAPGAFYSDSEKATLFTTRIKFNF